MKPRLALTVAVASVALTATACGSSSTDAGSTTSSTTSSSSSSSTSESPSESVTPSTSTSESVAPTMSPSMSPSKTMMAGAAALVGSGCADYAKAVPKGAGSVQGMSADVLATAASHNPLLTTLVAAVSGKLNPKVNLVNTLNTGQFTVFAPVDTAFTKLPAATVKTLTTNGPLLTKILTHHVIQGQLDASKIIGTHKTVDGGSVTVTGSGNNLKVDGTAKVICGNVKTANATVYLIDTVLTPKG